MHRKVRGRKALLPDPVHSEEVVVGAAGELLHEKVDAMVDMILCDARTACGLQWGCFVVVGKIGRALEEVDTVQLMHDVEAGHVGAVAEVPVVVEELDGGLDGMTLT
jgi:hypothetical protein